MVLGLSESGTNSSLSPWPAPQAITPHATCWMLLLVRLKNWPLKGVPVQTVPLHVPSPQLLTVMVTCTAAPGFTGNMFTTETEDAVNELTVPLSVEALSTFSPPTKSLKDLNDEFPALTFMSV